MIPSYKFRGDEATLSCYFDLEREELYSVKWYKDGHEFFRYIPGDRDQKVTVFSLPGVRVDVSRGCVISPKNVPRAINQNNFLQENRSDKNRVTLLSLNLNSAGTYRCEVSAEAPLFNTVSQRNRLSVIGKTILKKPLLRGIFIAIFPPSITNCWTEDIRRKT
jgi:hypothetical protein